jgi:hypothetical protein
MSINMFLFFIINSFKIYPKNWLFIFFFKKKYKKYFFLFNKNSKTMRLTDMICGSCFLVFCTILFHHFQIFYWNWQSSFDFLDFSKCLLIKPGLTYEILLLKHLEMIWGGAIGIVVLFCLVAILLLIMVILGKMLETTIRVMQIILYQLILREQKNILKEANTQNVYFLILQEKPKEKIEGEYISNLRIIESTETIFINSKINNSKHLTKQDCYNLITLPDDLLELIIIKLLTNYCYICFRICKKISAFTSSILKNEKTGGANLEYFSELERFINDSIETDIELYYGFKMHPRKITRKNNIALVYANDGFLSGLKWLCTENAIESDIYTIWGISFYAARKGHLNILKWLKNEKEFKYWKIGQLIKYAIIGGSVPTFLFVLDIKKDNIDNFKMKAFKFTQKIVNVDRCIIRHLDTESNYFYYSMIGNNPDMVEYIFKQGYETKMVHFYDKLEYFKKKYNKKITIRDILDEKIILFLEKKSII